MSKKMLFMKSCRKSGHCFLKQPTYSSKFWFRGICVIHGSLKELPRKVQSYITENVQVCQPEKVHICDGSEDENNRLLQLLHSQGTIVSLPKYKNCWLARTNPADTARVESKTFICTENRRDAIPVTKSGVPGTLGNWMSLKDADTAVEQRFRGCMKGRTMYVIPFSMGPIGSPLSKLGIEITDSPYVVVSMRIMTRMGKTVWDLLTDNCDFVKCLHSVGRPSDGKIDMPSWPCDPIRTLILHKPQTNDIMSYGSGYGGNSLLGKKCFALRIGSTIAKREGWLAEHMLILGITNPRGKKRYIAAAFPSACGKTNLAMMTPSLKDFKVECVGDDIAWMRFDSNGHLNAINPENGFFGVAPGTSTSSNPIAMKTIFKNTIFTNVASTSDGGVYWEGMENDVDLNSVEITDWQHRLWARDKNSPAAHPNSRFCTPASQCPIIDSEWESAKGVPISAILFGGRRPEGVPLVYEARDWKHGVLIGASMRSEATAAAEHRGKLIMHDPFAMRPFLGYNFGDYLQHWLNMDNGNRRLPKIFHVNWFRKGTDGQYLWPGYGENCRVLEWILRRIDGEDCAQDCPIGLIPKPNALDLNGLEENVDMTQLFHLSKEFWVREVETIEKYFNEQVGEDLPHTIVKELALLKHRIDNM